MEVDSSFSMKKIWKVWLKCLHKTLIKRVLQQQILIKLISNLTICKVKVTLVIDN